jgi:hypothetical protein
MGNGIMAIVMLVGWFHVIRSVGVSEVGVGIRGRVVRNVALIVTSALFFSLFSSHLSIDLSQFKNLTYISLRACFVFIRIN